MISILSSCRDSAPEKINPDLSVNNKSNLSDSPQTTPATISEIQSQPVWLRRLKATTEISAQQGMGLQIGEIIRTEGKAMAQIDLKNGLAFRIGGNAVLTLQPDNRLNLSAGEMITWVTPGKKVPTQVITPGGIAGIRGTTIHIKMPKNPQDAVEFFTWEGTMFIHLPNQSEEFQLQAGEIVEIKPGETNLSKVRASVRRLTSQEWLTRRQNSSLLNKFDKPLSTLQKIDKIAPSDANKKSLTAEPISPKPPTSTPIKSGDNNTSTQQQSVTNSPSIIQNLPIYPTSNYRKPITAAEKKIGNTNTLTPKANVQISPPTLIQKLPNSPNPNSSKQPNVTTKGGNDNTSEPNPSAINPSPLIQKLPNSPNPNSSKQPNSAPTKDGNDNTVDPKPSIINSSAPIQNLPNFPNPNSSKQPNSAPTKGNNDNNVDTQPSLISPSTLIQNLPNFPNPYSPKQPNFTPSKKDSNDDISEPNQSLITPPALIQNLPTSPNSNSSGQPNSASSRNGNDNNSKPNQSLISPSKPRPPQNLK